VETLFDLSIGEWGGNSRTVLRGLADDGETTFTLDSGLRVGEAAGRVVGDVTGGVIMEVTKEPTTQAEFNYDSDHGGSEVTLVKVGTPLKPGGWRYSLGRGYPQSLSSFAQAHDGTLWGLKNRGIDLFGLDSSTGTVTHFLTAPPVLTHYRSDACPQLNSDSALPPYTYPPFSEPRVDRAGNIDVVVLQREVTHHSYALPPSCTSTEESVSIVSIVTLYRISPDGAVQTTELGRYNSGRWAYSGGGAFVLPDDAGGVMASWLVCSGITDYDSSCVSYDRRAKYFGPNNVGNEFSLTNGFVPANQLIEHAFIAGHGGTAFDYSGAFNMITGSRLWSKPGSSTPIAVLQNGMSLYGSYNVPSVAYDASGNVVNSAVPALYDLGNTNTGPVLLTGGSQIGWFADFVNFGAVISNEMYLEPEAGFVTPQGNARKSNGPQLCVPPIEFPQLATPVDYTFAFDDEIPGFPDAGRFGTFSADEKGLFVTQFHLWYFGGDRGFTKGLAA
jgi:hypothetical protein